MMPFLLISLLFIGLISVWIILWSSTTTANVRKHGGWSGGIWYQARYKIKRGAHIHRYYGSWEKAIAAGYKKDGVYHIPIPDDLKKIIDSDPECHP